jgi:hypothetical protein
VLCALFCPIIEKRKTIGKKIKKQNSENCSVFLFSDDLMDLAIEGVV